MPIKRLLSKNVRNMTSSGYYIAFVSSQQCFEMLSAHITYLAWCQHAQVEVRLKRTVTKPSFLMPLTNPKFDVDVSAAMVNGGAVEMGLSQVCHGLMPSGQRIKLASLLDCSEMVALQDCGAVTLILFVSWWQVWYFRLKNQCIKPDGSRGLVVDVGGNFGWYSLFAAAMGCR
jgi:hypothetical protein